jgi:hypothetical protein
VASLLLAVLGGDSNNTWPLGQIVLQDVQKFIDDQQGKIIIVLSVPCFYWYSKWKWLIDTGVSIQ